MNRSLKDVIDENREKLETMSFNGVSKVTIVFLSIFALGCAGLSFYWDFEPDLFTVRDNQASILLKLARKPVTGSATIATMITMTDILLHKPGGYLSNDMSPPGSLMDNIPNWEFGVLVQLRDMARTLRNNLSRSQSQSQEDADLVTAENQFYFDNEKWIFPESESEYQKAITALSDYLLRLGDERQSSAQFYARADNLRIWLSEVETRLGNISQKLSASVGKRQLDTALAGDSSANQSTVTDKELELKTPWSELDDVFYQARGTTWALIHLLSAVEIDFADVLEKKNATVSLQQIIRELEPTQDALWSPVILNGSGLGILANHSLVMASHVSRANAALIDLRRLLEQG